MTAVDLDALDAARAAATPGPWERGGYQVVSPGGVVAETDTTADAALIVAAVNALPKLTAAVRAVLDLADDWQRYRVVPSDLADRLRATLAAALTSEGGERE